MGIQPDFIVGRATRDIDDKRKEKVAYYCNMKQEDVISNPDMDSIYQIPLKFHEQNFDQKVLKKLSLPYKHKTLKSWHQLIDNIFDDKKDKATVAIIAKYITTGDYELKDSYASLIESLKHASWANKLDLK